MRYRSSSNGAVPKISASAPWWAPMYFPPCVCRWVPSLAACWPSPRPAHAAARPYRRQYRRIYRLGRGRLSHYSFPLHLAHSRHQSPHALLLCAARSRCGCHHRGRFPRLPQLGLIAYCCGWALSLQQWLANVLTVAKDPRDRITFASVSVLMASLWLVLSLVYYTVQHFFMPEPALPTLALLVGFAGQLLIGVMSYLLPSTMGGGPAAVRRGLAATGQTRPPARHLCQRRAAHLDRHRYFPA